MYKHLFCFATQYILFVWTFPVIIDENACLWTNIWQLLFFFRLVDIVQMYNTYLKWTMCNCFSKMWLCFQNQKKMVAGYDIFPKLNTYHISEELFFFF